MCLVLFACQKSEVTPSDALENTMWTGFFEYEPVKRESAPQLPLRQCFAMEFLSTGEFKFYEALKITGGFWRREADNTIVINQSNRNKLIFQYYPTTQKMVFQRIEGAPGAWSASDIEKADPAVENEFKGTKWYAPNGLYLLFDTYPNQDLSYVTYENALGTTIDVHIRKSAITHNPGYSGIFICRNDRVLYYTNFSGGYITDRGTTISYTKK